MYDVIGWVLILAATLVALETAYWQKIDSLAKRSEELLCSTIAVVISVTKMSWIIGTSEIF